MRNYTSAPMVHCAGGILMFSCIATYTGEKKLDMKVRKIAIERQKGVVERR